MVSGKIKQPIWLLILYFVVGFSIIRIFRVMEYPYWLGILISFCLIMLMSSAWRKYKTKSDYDIDFIETGDTKPVAGIETVIIDGIKHFYAYDFSADEVVSPLFQNETSMAEFAESNLNQKDGKHSQAYWLELIEYSKDESEIFEEVPSLLIDEVKELWSCLKQAKAQGNIKKIENLNPFISDVLINLERENIDSNIWGELTIKSDFELLDLSSEDILEMIKHVLGMKSDYSDVTYQDAASISITYLNSIAQNLEHSWQDVLEGKSA
ncbi:hypothetical protein [Paraferrimonas sp. SM1919]|uniref:hypothetical protein n=1 Tax=Paraferrimonas sp. SM1919 TaxID=2662263 RepID=UPI0013D719FE|nr:hypothetical protein [Paraferrimonas sp. SM1919]